MNFSPGGGGPGVGHREPAGGRPLQVAARGDLGGKIERGCGHLEPDLGGHLDPAIGAGHELQLVYARAGGRQFQVDRPGLPGAEAADVELQFAPGGVRHPVRHHTFEDDAGGRAGTRVGDGDDHRHRSADEHRLRGRR
jgi:hypothetical protein